MTGRRWGISLGLVTATVGLAACGGGGSSAGPSSGGPVQVVASTNVWGDIARTIGGDQVQVTSFINDPSQDPHEYEASVRNQLAIKNAGIVIENGGGYDDFMDKMVTSVGDSNTVLNAVEISGKTAAAGEDLNEHVWYDFPTVLKVAGAIKDKLATLDPAHANTFATNLAGFTDQMKTLEAQAASVKAAHNGQPVAITEPVPGYLLEACGLVNKTPEAFSAAIEDGNDVSVGVLNETLKLFTAHQVKALVYNAQTTGPITQKVLDTAKSAHVPAVPVTETLPAGSTYVTWMKSQLTALSDALDQP
ncbi:zinc ABC transporter substrate-binding protein [Branchiibius sp. NY16-3462-2]|uniref:metal ABC transporter solute-binding protein, Zn/Mn family n=1 Tax=Branchiibius sp. NY16-3462-2 TaxID=1807500 RepID=UPI0007969AD4|nr:zinc ABC transporter substrate-binding protein [Branchiibius sp. NY16-3462-2]KYH45116.1 ABC transporter substrate-binding protein [Branchiibius sp. NY16-3462-2]